MKARRAFPTPCRHAPRQGRCRLSSSLKLPNRCWAGRGARTWEPGLSWRRRGKQVKREGRGRVTAHKSPSPTLGPHRRGAPTPRGMEGHSATPGRPLNSSGASAPPWAQASLVPAPARIINHPPDSAGSRPWTQRASAQGEVYL